MIRHCGVDGSNLRAAAVLMFFLYTHTKHMCVYCVRIGRTTLELGR